MTSTYLLTATLVVCSVSALAQQNTSSSSTEAQKQEKPAWKLSFNPSENLLANDRALRLIAPEETLWKASGDRLLQDSVCFNIRSYVVARDSKDSDSVHPVRYSTCQPANRYRLRTTQVDIPSKH